MLAESIRDELVKVFTVPQAEVLARCVVTAHEPTRAASLTIAYGQMMEPSPIDAVGATIAVG